MGCLSSGLLSTINVHPWLQRTRRVSVVFFKAEGRLSAVFLGALWHLERSANVTAERGGMPQRYVSYYYPL